MEGDESFFEEDYDFARRVPQTADTGSFLSRLRTWLFGARVQSEELSERLKGLDQAIKQYPDAPANYVLRGEILLKQEAYELALADFRLALELAATQFETDDWGILSQALLGRAEMGLRKAQHLLEKD